MRALLIAALLAAAPAVAGPVPAGSERVPVINLQLTGEPKFETVVLPSPPNDTLMLHVCVREYDAAAIRCYVLDVSDRTNPKWWTVDIGVQK